MNRQGWTWIAAGVSALFLVAAIVAGSAFAQEAGKAKAAGGEKKAPAAKAKPKGRLPAHYAKVVDEKQRAAIYALQAEFAAKKEAIQKQLDALEAEEGAAIEAVLTPEQKQELAAIREEAKAAREKKGAEKKAAGEKEAAEKPAAKKAA